MQFKFCNKSNNYTSLPIFQNLKVVKVKNLQILLVDELLKKLSK